MPLFLLVCSTQYCIHTHIHLHTHSLQCFTANWYLCTLLCKTVLVNKGKRAVNRYTITFLKVPMFQFSNQANGFVSYINWDVFNVIIKYVTDSLSFLIGLCILCLMCIASFGFLHQHHLYQLFFLTLATHYQHKHLNLLSTKFYLIICLMGKKYKTITKPTQFTHTY